MAWISYVLFFLWGMLMTTFGFSCSTYQFWVMLVLTLAIQINTIIEGEKK